MGDSSTLTYTLVRSRRKTIAIYVRDGVVEVRAPLKAPSRDINRFIHSKINWINDRMERTAEQAERREAFSIDYGGGVSYRGRTYPVAAGAGRRAGFDGEAFIVPAGYAPEQVMRVCVMTYRKLAGIYINERVNYYSERMSASPAAVRITGAKTRWGSCSAKKSVNFSWRLVMADDGVIDYVVVHELAHLTEMNHSERFWTIVEKTLPDYSLRKKRLRALQKRLVNENWDV